MAGLFDLPTSRTNKGADINVVNKSTNRKSAQVVSRGGGLLEKIATINSLVESKLGKYKDNYTYFMAKDEELLKDYIYNTIQTGYVAMDTETTGLDPMQDDIVGFLVDKNVPGDAIVYSDLADEILRNKPKQGYLTISNALQWRLQYTRVISLENTVNGVLNYEWQ